MNEHRKRFPKPSKRTVLIITVTFILGALSSAFILGSMLIQMESKVYTTPPPIPAPQSREAKLTQIEEVLKVEAELNRVRSEIERLTGQIQYLRT